MSRRRAGVSFGGAPPYVERERGNGASFLDIREAKYFPLDFGLVSMEDGDTFATRTLGSLRRRRHQRLCPLDQIWRGPDSIIQGIQK